MLKLRIAAILKEQGHTKYWLYKQMDLSYQNLSRIMNNETTSIHFDVLERFSKVLEVPVGDLFESADSAETPPV